VVDRSAGRTETSGQMLGRTLARERYKSGEQALETPIAERSATMVVDRSAGRTETSGQM